MAQNSCLNGWQKFSPNVQPCCLPHACFLCIIFGSLPPKEPLTVMDPPRNQRTFVFPSSTRRLDCMVMSAAEASSQVEACHPTSDVFSQPTAPCPPNDRINQALLRLAAYTKPIAPALPICQPRNESPVGQQGLSLVTVHVTITSPYNLCTTLHERDYICLEPPADDTSALGAPTPTCHPPLCTPDGSC